MPPLVSSRLVSGNAKGPVALFTSAVVFAFFDSMMKHLAHLLPSGEIVLVRFSVGLIIAAPALIRQISHLDFKSLALLLTRGLLGVLALFSFLQALRLGTLSGTMVLLFTNPIWALVLSVLLLGEPLTRARVVGVMVAFLGAVIVMNPWYTGIAVGDLLGLASGALTGAAMVVIRYLRARLEPIIIYGFHSIVGTVLAIPAVIYNPAVPEMSALIILLVASVLGLVAQLGMAYGLRYVRAAEGAVILMMETMLTILFGALWFHEQLAAHFLVGAAMILGSSVALARIGVYDARPAAPGKQSPVV